MDAQSQADLVAEYDVRKPGFDKLRQEVLYAIKTELDSICIKYHSVNGRVKTKESFLKKITRKEYSDPFNDVHDFVGIRVVCLFIADLPRVRKIIHSTFSVTSEEDKILAQGVDTFGYMSHHFICTLGASLAGPRYDDIKNIVFEVQVRTILMDAWANISHYLAYKGEASVPDDLQRDFNALSGLFYVADRHFEFFYHESQASKDRAKLTITEPGSQDTRLDRDTTLALFQELYPDRRHASPEYVSEFVEEVLPFNYKTIGDLRSILKSSHETALRFESSEYQLNFFTDVGIARHALAISDPTYRRRKYRSDGQRYTNFRQ